ncbi:MAG: hypothetical protein GF330_04920 [Candidatus Eisenbacteria bacterium]|nr:hypothetical protein [Candidatus Eisenbacteria bacterium]
MRLRRPAGRIELRQGADFPCFWQRRSCIGDPRPSREDIVRSHLHPLRCSRRAGSRASVLLALLAAVVPAGATDLQGALSGDLPAGVYRIVDDIHVPAGETLTLAPGVVFQFEDSFWEEYEFDVYGTLLAQGTAEQPILFQTAPGAAEYNYIRITTSSTRLAHCVFEGIGSVALFPEGGLWIDDCRPIITDCTVRDCHWHGVYVTGSGALPHIERLHAHGNQADGVDCDAGAGLTLIGARVHDNGGDGVCLAAGSNSIVGCLIVRNAEDGIDCHGLTDFDATVINCTIAASGSENLSDESNLRLYNSLVVGSAGSPAEVVHSFTVADAGFYRFVDPGAGDYRLSDDSPARDRGTRFGPPETWLPDEDLDGQPRIVGIVDLGAYERPRALPPATGGTYFSAGLLQPRMTQPAIRTSGESFEAWIAMLGSYGPPDVQAELVGPLGESVPLVAESLVARLLEPGSEEALLLHAPGLERIQQIRLRLPTDCPPALYGIRVSVDGHLFQGIHAVRVVAEYPPQPRFLHITDTHVGYDAEEYTATERLRFFVREANFLNPDLVVLTGDVCENQRLGNAAFVDSMLAAVAELRVPLFVQPGNHDYYNAGSETYDPGYPLRYFERVNRFRNAHLRLGHAHFIALTSRHNLGLLEFYRCLGPTAAALDWAAAELAQLDPVADHPRFLMMHGPNYDYFSWNEQNVDRVRGLIDDHAIDLCLCGHTHRFETFLNEGDNYLGRNDFQHEDDWERDVPFPGYPLHVQSSSLGKEEHLPLPEGTRERFADLPEPRRRGLFGDDIGWRYVQIRNGEVAFFTADTDGDGYRNTEDPWLLGEIAFALEVSPEGVHTSTVTNSHYEDWSAVRHCIPAEPGVEYVIEGGTLVRQEPDGTMIVQVAQIAAQSSSVVTLTPAPSDAPAGDPRGDAPLAWSLRPSANPSRGALRFRATWKDADVPPSLQIHDAQGRLVRDLSDRLTGAAAGHRSGDATITWDGRDGCLRPVAPGVYFVRLFDPRRQVVLREVRVR